MSTRRGVLGVLSGAAIGGPKIAKNILEELPKAMPSSFGPPQADPFPTGKDLLDLEQQEGWLMALADRVIKDEIESLYYEICGSDIYIPPDIDVMKSFSHMAKKTFARQRWVEKQMRLRRENTGRKRLEKIMKRFFGKDVLIDRLVRYIGD